MLCASCTSVIFLHTLHHAEDVQLAQHQPVPLNSLQFNTTSVWHGMQVYCIIHRDVAPCSLPARGAWLVCATAAYVSFMHRTLCTFCSAVAICSSSSSASCGYMSRPRFSTSVWCRKHDCKHCSSSRGPGHVFGIATSRRVRPAKQRLFINAGNCLLLRIT